MFLRDIILKDSNYNNFIKNNNLYMVSTNIRYQKYEPEVERLQNLVNDKFEDCIVVDGIFGTKTYSSMLYVLNKLTLREPNLKYNDPKTDSLYKDIISKRRNMKMSDLESLNNLIEMIIL